MVPHIKYTLVFDENIDGPELRNLFANEASPNNQQLLEEIFEEEKYCEIAAK